MTALPKPPTTSTRLAHLDIGIVIVVGASGDGDVLVGHFDVFRVGLEIFGSYHDDETNRLLVLEQLVTPSGEKIHDL